MKFLETAAAELNVMLDEVMESNGIVRIDEDLVKKFYYIYVWYKIRVLLVTLFYWFIGALLIVYLVSSEVIELPEWCRVIFSLGIIRFSPIIKAQVKEELMDRFSGDVFDIFKNNQDQWYRKGSLLLQKSKVFRIRTLRSRKRKRRNRQNLRLS